MIALIVSAFIVSHKYYRIHFTNKNGTQSALFFAFVNVTQSVRIFVYKRSTKCIVFAQKS